MRERSTNGPCGAGCVAMSCPHEHRSDPKVSPGTSLSEGRGRLTERSIADSGSQRRPLFTYPVTISVQQLLGYCVAGAGINLHNAVPHGTRVQARPHVRAWRRPPEGTATSTTVALPLGQRHTTRSSWQRAQWRVTGHLCGETLCDGACQASRKQGAARTTSENELN